MEANLGYRLKNIFVNTNLFRLLVGEFISSIGTKMYQVSIIWLIYTKTGSKTFVGLLMIAAFLPGVLLSPISGVYVDRINLKKIIVYINIIESLLMLTLGLLIIINVFNLPILICLTAFISICDSFFKPAVSSFIPCLAEKEKLVKINSIQELFSNFAKIVGPVLGSIIMASFGIIWVLIIDAFSFLFSAFLEFYIKTYVDISKLKNKKLSFKENYRQSLSYLSENTFILNVIIIICLMNLFTGSIQIILPSFIKDDLQLNETYYSIVVSSIAIGAILTSILISIKFKIKKEKQVLSFALVCYGMLMISLKFTGNYYWTLLVFSGIGACTSLFDIIVVSMLQSNIPSNIRGKIFSVVIGISMGLVPLSYGIFGILGDIISNRNNFFVVGCSLLLGGFYIFWLKVNNYN